jgi:hypothetical protein
MVDQKLTRSSAIKFVRGALLFGGGFALGRVLLLGTPGLKPIAGPLVHRPGPFALVKMIKNVYI